MFNIFSQSNNSDQCSNLMTIALVEQHDNLFDTHARCHNKSSAVAKKRRPAEKIAQNCEFSRQKITRKSWEYPNALWYPDIFGLGVYNRMQKLKLCASVNARCNFVTERSDHIGIHAVACMTAKTHAVVHRETVGEKYF